MVKNTRAKIRRAKKNHNIDLSQHVNIPSLKEFKHRKDFNRFKKEMQSFTNRRNKEFQVTKNKYGVPATYGELEKAKSFTEKAKELTKSFVDNLKDRPVYRGGKKSGKVAGNIEMMGEADSVGVNPPKDFDFDKIQTRKRFEDRMRNMERKSEDVYYDETKERMKQNYIDLLNKGMNNASEPIIAEIEKMSAEGFYQMWVQVSEVDFNLYDSEGLIMSQMSETEVDQHVSSVLHGIERFKKEYGSDGNNDLKAFR